MIKYSTYLLRLTLIFSFASTSYCVELPHFLQPPNAKGSFFFSKKHYEEAQRWFKDPAWKASSAYRAKDYKTAYEYFAQLNTENGYYNAGNALAQMGKYQDAIQFYDKALTINPKHEDAIFNRKLLSDLMKKEASENASKQEKPQQNIKKDNPSPSPKQNRNNEQKKGEGDPLKKTTNEHESTQSNPHQKSIDDHHTPSSKRETEKKAQRNKEEIEKQKQWLRLIPDEPHGLLRQKLLRDYQQKLSGASS